MKGALGIDSTLQSSESKSFIEARRIYLLGTRSEVTLEKKFFDLGRRNRKFPP